MSAAIEHIYRYPFASSIEAPDGRPALALAPSAQHDQFPHFFTGKIRQPRLAAAMLLALSDVVRTHYFLPLPPLLDPVLTNNDSMLRFEGFSGCCGVYARLDLGHEGIDGTVLQRGTTNVDFNEPLRNTLRQVGTNDSLQLTIGKSAVELATSRAAIVEKKVKLPLRWLKCFSEVQAYQTKVTLLHELNTAAALQLLRSLPKQPPKRALYLVGNTRNLRFSPRAQPGSLSLLGSHRLAVLLPLLPSLEQLRIWFDGTTGISAWEVVAGAARFTLLLSPEVFRGFSGEGQLLQTLADSRWQTDLNKVRAQLAWQNELDVPALANELDLSHERVTAALAVLGSQGVVGFDQQSGNYFHRVMPFDIAQVEDLQPRLKAARKLISDHKVQQLSGSQTTEFSVAGSNVEHFVQLAPSGDRCTCPCFSKYQGQRGPCKHILAGQLAIGAPAS